MRNKADPYLVSGVIAGKDFIGFTDPFGTKLESDHVLTGMASKIFLNFTFSISNF